MFVALQSNEKFPDEGFDVDVQSKLEKNPKFLKSRFMHHSLLVSLVDKKHTTCSVVYLRTSNQSEGQFKC